MLVSSFAFAALVAAQAVTSTGTIQPAPAATITPALPQALIVGSTGNVLRSGVEVPLKLEEPLDSNNKQLREGQQFRLSVSYPVMLGNVVVIPAGSPAIGKITNLRRKGMWGKSGHINARFLNVRVGDRLIRLTGAFDEKGTTGTAGVVGAIVFLPVAGFFTTGTSAKIPMGAGVKAFLDEDLTIAMPLPAPTPVQASPAAVPVVAPAATTATAAPVAQAH